MYISLGQLFIDIVCLEYYDTSNSTTTTDVGDDKNTDKCNIHEIHVIASAYLRFTRFLFFIFIDLYIIMLFNFLIFFKKRIVTLSIGYLLTLSDYKGVYSYLYINIWYNFCIFIVANYWK